MRASSLAQEPRLASKAFVRKPALSLAVLLLGGWASAQEPQPAPPTQWSTHAWGRATAAQEEELRPLLERLGTEGLELPASREIYRRYTPEIERLFDEGDERLADLGADLADPLARFKLAEIRRDGAAYYLCFQLSPLCDAPARRLAWHIVFSPGSSVLESVRHPSSDREEHAMAILEAIERRLWGQMRQRDPGLEAAVIHLITSLRLDGQRRAWLALFTSSRDMDVRVAALRAMGSFGEENFIPEALDPRPAWFVEGMEDAVHCLAWGRPDALCAELLAQLLDRAGGAQADVRLFGLEGLAVLGDAALDHLPRIEEAMRRDPSPRVRERAAQLYFELNPVRRPPAGGVAMSEPFKAAPPESGAATGPEFAPAGVGGGGRIHRRAPPPSRAFPTAPSQSSAEPNKPEQE